MPSADKQVRVFISSTFRDMHGERDHLVTVVFPELREQVERLGLEFFDVDLRWGVPAKDANGETANSWEYCRQWIDRVEPFFVCTLGQRYGWVPEAKDFKSNEDKARQELDPRSITDLEVRHAVLDDHKKRRSYFYLRETVAPATATEYVDPPPLAGKLEQLKKEVRSCGRPVRDYPCEWTGSSFTGMHEFGRRVLEDLWSGVLRDERYVSKDVWRQILGTDPDVDPRYTDESEPVPRELWEKIISLAKPGPKEPLDAEREQTDAFAASRLRWFQGRTVELRQLTDFLDATAADAPRIAVVAAAPGQGKSALLAHLHKQLTSSPHFVITRFVGVTEHSATAHALVERLLCELDRSGVAWQAEGDEPNLGFNSLCLRLAQRLGDYAGEHRIVILLDALNQMSDGHDLQWLPTRLGPGVRVIVSCVEDPTAKLDSPEQQVLRALASRQPAPFRVPLGPLTADDVRTIVVAYLKEYCHELDREHLETLCGVAQARIPLYLLVMLDGLRTLGGNDLNRIVPKLIASMPSDHPDSVSLFRWVLKRLEVFGTEAVQWWCLYLAHGRVGMASHDLADLLARKLGADATATSLRIERGLRRYLQRRGAQLDFFHGQLRQAAFEEYGSRGEAATCHAEIAAYFDKRPNWIGREFLPLQPGKPDSRKADELPWQLSRAREPVKLARVLGDIGFLEAKISSGLSIDLLDDFKRLDQLCHNRQDGSAAEQELFRETLLLWQILGNTLDQIVTDPASIGMQLGLELQNIGAASPLQPREAALLKRLDLATNDRPCFSRFSGGMGVPYLAQTAMRQEFLRLVRFSPDGNALLFADGEGRVVRWRWSAPVLEQSKTQTAGLFRSAVMVSDGAIVFGGPLQVWMFSTEYLWDERFRAGVWRLVTASEEGTRLGGIAGSPSGMLLVGQSGPGMARILRFRGMEPVKPIRLPYSERDPDLNCMALSANEQTMVASFSDGVLAISTGFRNVVVQGGVRACAFLDGDLLVASLGSRGVLSIRDLAGQVRREVPLVHGDASCLAYSSQRKVIAVGHQNGYVSFVWLDESDFGTGPGFWPGVRGATASLDFSESGHYLAACGSQGVVRVFEVEEIQRAGRPRSIVQRGFPDGPIREVAFLNAQEGLAFLDRRQRLRINSEKSDSRYLPFGAQCFCYDPVSDRIVAARIDEIYFLEPGTGRVENQEHGHGSEPRAMAMSADGRLLAQREDSRLLIYEAHGGHTAMERRIDLFLTPFLDPGTETLNRAPLRFCRNGSLLACPLESTVAPRRQNESGAMETDVRRTLLLVDTASGKIAGRLQYRGFCTALDELPEKDILIIGLGRGLVDEGEHKIVVGSPDEALLFCSIGTCERLQSRALSREDLGVTGIAVARESNFKGCIVVACESGRVLLTSLQSELWDASICLPDPATAIRFYGSTVHVADNGSRRGHWPAIHEFALHFPFPNGGFRDEHRRLLHSE
jgi:WD40 repeat protein